MAREAFGHLAAAGIAGAQEQDSSRPSIDRRARQQHPHCGALPQRAFDFKLAAVGLDDVLDDGEAGRCRLIKERVLSPVKRSVDAVCLFGFPCPI
jgi:hypothetical protein